MTLCCIMDYIPDIELTIYHDNKPTSRRVNLLDRNIVYNHLWRIYHQKIPTRIRSTLTNTSVEDISLEENTRGVLKYEFETAPETYEIIHYTADHLSTIYLNNRYIWLPRIYQPLFIREVFNGSEDECLIKKLSSSKKWVPYCSVEQHFEIIKDHLK